MGAECTKSLMRNRNRQLEVGVRLIPTDLCQEGAMQSVSQAPDFLGYIGPPHSPCHPCQVRTADQKETRPTTSATPTVVIRARGSRQGCQSLFTIVFPEPLPRPGRDAGPRELAPSVPHVLPAGRAGGSQERTFQPQDSRAWRPALRRAGLGGRTRGLSSGHLVEPEPLRVPQYSRPAPAPGSLTVAAASRVPLPPQSAVPGPSAGAEAPPGGRTSLSPAPPAARPRGGGAGAVRAAPRGPGSPRPHAPSRAGPPRPLQTPGEPSLHSRVASRRPGPQDSSPRTPTPPLRGPAGTRPRHTGTSFPPHLTSGFTPLSSDALSLPFPRAECPATSLVIPDTFHLRASAASNSPAPGSLARFTPPTHSP
ncbi:uncharacterized protein LOC135321361 [Camelus dromedarius]|uniref:uncharacterized protein LOC135321361 n=1 Tax=Camelus dromedarius TaxID=9838 RepID=UPI00311A15DF